ncbi:MAG TPA: YciI family protein [Candidatus Dormibacteraeota bacterium]|nr:YciI family protein [Candidatus Dormibacteraeota bacterium]
MKYLYLLYADESKMPAPGSAQFDAQNDAFNKYFAEIDGKGMFKAGDPVHPSTASKTVRVRNSSTQATSGPFVHGGDQLVGFYVIEAKDHDEAVAYAAKCPVAHVGAVEVRPILSM